MEVWTDLFFAIVATPAMHAAIAPFYVALLASSLFI
jgi:hypothetical protein